MVSSNPCPNRPLGVREQLARVRMAYPHFYSEVRGPLLRIEGNLRPTPRSVDYRVRIEYKVGDSPNVWVLSPELEPREPGGAIKHVYPGNRLCLYLPRSGEWSSDRSLAHLIIPWTAEWLLHYEVWHATGEWVGGGVEPIVRKVIRNESRDRPYDRKPR